MRAQRTLERAVGFEGVGVHSGRPVRGRLLPALAGGRRFLRTDLPEPVPLRAQLDAARDGQLATTLAVEGTSVSTVEHLLAALGALGIDHLRVELNGPELPALDGSALPWCALLDMAGVSELHTQVPTWTLTQPYEHTHGARSLRFEPASELELTVTVDFPHPLIGQQRLQHQHGASRFREELAPARSFGFAHQVDALHAAGRAKGAGLHNTLVFDADQVLNPGGQRMDLEPVRHKTLDLLGDIGLLEWPLQARVIAHRPGHAFTHAALRGLRDSGALRLIP